MTNWYKKTRTAQAFGTDPFGGSYLSERVKNSPWGFAGGDEKTGVFEPSSGKNHPNNYMSEEKENFLTEKQLEERKKKRNKKRKKIDPKEIKDCVKSLCKALSECGEEKKAQSVHNLSGFMPIKTANANSKNYDDAYEEFLNKMLPVIGDSIASLKKKAQWGLNGPKIPTWGNSDWVTDTYKEIMGNESDGESEGETLDDLLDATLTVTATNAQGQEIGTAFFIDQNTMLTCSHVVNPMGAPADNIVVKFQKNEYSAKVISSNPALDVATLSILDQGFSYGSPLKIGNSGAVKQGDKIYIIGTPLGFENVVGEGIVSSLPVDYSDNEGDKKYIFISSNINPGNSGGPVIRQSDRTVIGVAAAVINTEESGNSGLNAAIPIDDIKGFLGRK